MTAQRVLITAGASGIGLALARRFHARGDRVAICDVDADAVARMQIELPDVIAEVVNVTDEAQMNAFLTRLELDWGGIDVVCANAGTGGPAGLIETLDYADWQACIAVNLHGAFLTCRWAARVMREQGSGLIVLTSSTAGLFRLSAALALLCLEMGPCRPDQKRWRLSLARSACVLMPSAPARWKATVWTGLWRWKPRQPANLRKRCARNM